MTINFSLNIVLLIIGIIIGLFTAATLLLSKQNQKANLYLSLLVLICVGSLFHNFLLDAGIYTQKPGLYFLPVILSLGIGPLLYLYVNRLISLKPAKGGLVFLHLLPVIAQFAFFLISFLQNPDIKYDIYSKLYKPIVSPVQNIAAYISVSIYVYLSFKEIDFYKKQLNYFYSNQHQIALQWLQRLLFAFVFYYLLSIFFIIISYSFNISENYFPSDLIRCLIIFVIAFFALRQNSLINIRENIRSIQNEEKELPATINIEEPPAIETIKTETAAITHAAPKIKEINTNILNRIIALVEDEKLFLNEELTIADLANIIGYSTKTISYTINNGLNKSFSFFINEYRVNLFKERRGSGKFNHLSIMGLAYDCGFNSKSTFNRIYKEITGSSPKEEKSVV
jgi:AraC-like DNA-binding protein